MRVHVAVSMHHLLSDEGHHVRMAATSGAPSAAGALRGGDGLSRAVASRRLCSCCSWHGASGTAASDVAGRAIAP